MESQPSSAISHDHSADAYDFYRAFAIGIALNTVYVAIEAGVGLAVGSLGLVAEAGHNATDVLSLIVAWAGARLAQRAPSERYTVSLDRRSLPPCSTPCCCLQPWASSRGRRSVDYKSPPPFPEVPQGIDATEVRQRLKDLPGIAEVHDLHIWAMSTTKTALTAHLAVTDDVGERSDLLRAASKKLHDEFGIEHTTLQMEAAGAAPNCEQESPRAV